MLLSMLPWICGGMTAHWDLNITLLRTMGSEGLFRTLSEFL